MTEPLAFKKGDTVTLVKTGREGVVTKIWERQDKPLFEVKYIGAHDKETWCYFFASELKIRIVPPEKPNGKKKTDA
jgi:hypothetical protein